MAIPFIQYLRPLGQPKPVEIDRPAEIEAMADAFLKAGGRYECEVLTTGEVSFTAVKSIDDEERDIAIEICENGPSVLMAVDELIKRSMAHVAPTSAEREP